MCRGKEMGTIVMAEDTKMDRDDKLKAENERLKKLLSKTVKLYEELGEVVEEYRKLAGEERKGTVSEEAEVKKLLEKYSLL